MMVVDYLDLCNKTYIATYYYKSSSFIFYRFLNIEVGCDMYGRKARILDAFFRSIFSRLQFNPQIYNPYIRWG